MEYKVVKVYNNNVVLANQNGRDVIIVSKGIGFGKKTGDIISSNHSIEKVFHEINLDEQNVNLNEISKVRSKVKEITHQIILIAESKLGELNQNIEKGLIEHIEFALERLEMGLVIENPFIDEIIYLYREEYKIAEIAGELISDQLGIEIGNQEQGFIALHLYSARTNKTIGETIKSTRIYKECLAMVEQVYDGDIFVDDTMSKQFLNTIKITIARVRNEKPVIMPLKEQVPKAMPKSYKVAKAIAEYIKNETSIEVSEDIIAFLTVDIEKLVQ